MRRLLCVLAVLLSSPAWAQNVDDQGNPVYGVNFFRYLGVAPSATNPVFVSGSVVPATSLLSGSYFLPKETFFTRQRSTPPVDGLGNWRVASMLTDGQNYGSIKPAGSSPQPQDPSVVTALSPNPSLQCPFTVGISQTASARIVAGLSGRYLHVCTFAVISATAQSLSLVEGTVSTCGTGTVALYGGTSASAAMAANGGVHGISDRITIPMQVKGDDLCLLQSSTGNISGSLTYGVY